MSLPEIFTNFSFEHIRQTNVTVKQRKYVTLLEFMELTVYGARVC